MTVADDKTAAERATPTPENSPTLAAHAKAAEFGLNLSSTAAAYIAEAVLAASGLRVADRRAAPDRETLYGLIRNAWTRGKPGNSRLTMAVQAVDALLASGVFDGVPADVIRAEKEAAWNEGYGYPHKTVSSSENPYRKAAGA